ncbi:hypothetical protein D3C73_1567570 [compost metagenome]
MVTVDHNQAVIPDTAVLELLDELSERIVGIILGPDIVSDKGAFIPLRQLHLIFLGRNRKRMVR